MDTNDYNTGLRLNRRAEDRNYSSQVTKQTVLLAEDEYIQRLVSESMLRQNGYEVITCVNGAEAVERYKEMYEKGTLPCAILMDLEMPEKDGFEATREIKNISIKRRGLEKGIQDMFSKSIDFIYVPIIAYTTLEKEDIQGKLNEYGFSGYMFKPANKTEFLSVLNSYARPM